jgi:hypothetical protein
MMSAATGYVPKIAGMTPMSGLPRAIHGPQTTTKAVIGAGGPPNIIAGRGNTVGHGGL